MKKILSWEVLLQNNNNNDNNNDNKSTHERAHLSVEPQARRLQLY